MNSIISDNWHQKDLRPFAVIVSLFLSLYTIGFPDNPNDDAFVYIHAAEIMLNEGIGAAYAYYAWASYSLLIAALGSVGIDLFLAAHLINALFFALLVYAFLSIARHISDEPVFNFFAAVVILLYPELNEYRYDIIRDVGFWALGLLALLQLIEFRLHGHWAQAAAFCASLLVAATMRPEALLYLVLLPATLLLNPGGTESRAIVRLRCLRLYGLVAALGVAGLLALALLGVNLLGLFDSFSAGYQLLLQGNLNPDPETVASMGAIIFGEYASAYSQEYATLVIATGLLSVLVANVWSAIGGPYFWLLVWGALRQRLRYPATLAPMLLLCILLNLVILLVFLYVTRYLTSRYAMFLSLIVILLVPQVLATLRTTVSARRQGVLQWALIIFFTYCAIDSFYSFGDSKEYVFEAIQWIDENRQEPARLITNNNTIAYFAERNDGFAQVQPTLSAAEILTARPGDLIAIEWSVEMSQVLNESDVAAVLDLLTSFMDEDDERVEIYRRL